ncbi:MAG: hypothetical protein ACE37F_24875 [Nannocystaceae bacterium]|nr:hypothetical protein [bacterium]
MKLPRKGILIRLAIYLPIIGFLSWKAFFAGGDEQPAPEPEQTPPGRVRTIAGPDGQEMKIIEITPDEAKAMGVEIPDPPAGAPANEADAPKEPQ